MSYLNDITFAHKSLLWLLLILPMSIGWYVWKGRNAQGSLLFSSLGSLTGAPRSFRHYLRHVVFVLRSLTLLLLILILARPQSHSSWKNISTEGINIIITMDISSSMLAQDLRPDRIEASKSVASQFIDNRPNDRIGLVIFSGESFTLCPLTTDHAVVKNLFSGIHTGLVEDGTAIGMGLATAVSRLDTNAKSNVIILLTDGVNNRGSIDPITAAEIAHTYKARVYTIGLGTRGKALAPVARDALGRFQYDYVNVDLDEAMLKQVASLTGGKYFRATDTETLKKIYHEIDAMEKNIIEEKNFTNKQDLFLPLALAALALLFIEFVIKNTWIRSIT